MITDGIPDLGAMLGEVMRDPEKMAQLRTIMASLGSVTQASEPPKEEAAPVPSAHAEEEETTSHPASPDILGSLLANPALLTQLPTLLGAFSGEKEGPPSGAESRRRPDHRTALLLALKPYLSDGRRQMIDYIVNISRLGDQLGR